MLKIKAVHFISSFVIVLLLCSPVYATFYSYDQQIGITDSDGSSLGYVLPYKVNGLFNDYYAYLRWKRTGFPEGNTFPVFLVEGTTAPLIFGIEGEFLKVKVNSISSSGVDLSIDKSDVITEIEQVAETVENTNQQIAEDINEAVKQTNVISNDIDNEATNTINLLDQRVNKAIDRGYYSSLHIINSRDLVAKEVSQKIVNKETEFAEKISDRIIPIVLDSFAVGTGITYTVLIKLIPSSLRHEMTIFLYNIDTKYDSSYNDASLSNKGAVTIYIGNPKTNAVSAQLNSQLKSLGLPYFEGEKIIGKRTYSEGSIGLVAAIPEEKVWTETTLENRWNNDRIRTYKTLIAGIDDEGLDAAADWYNDQLDNAATLITSVASLTNGADSSDILKIVTDNFNKNPKSTISSATLLEGWILTGFSSLQSADFETVDSLGYVAIVKKNGNSYDILEIHTINGYQTNYFLNPYEIVEEVVDVVEQVNEITETVESASEDMITGNAVGVPEELPVSEENEPEANKRIPVISWFADIFRRWFG